MKTKIIMLSLAAILMISVAFTLNKNKRTVEENVYRPDTDKSVLVQAEKARVSVLENTFGYIGTFEPVREVVLVSQVQGEVRGVFFEEGEEVKAGEVLIKIDDDLLQAQYIAATANYETSAKVLERYAIASSGGGVSNLQLDNLRLNVANAESQVKQLEHQIDVSRIVAPFAGTMTMRSVDPGAMAGTSPLARITDLSELKLRISIPENEISLFNKGQIVPVSSDVHAGKIFRGVVEYVSDRADESHNYDVKILVKNNDRSASLKAGMYGVAQLKEQNPEKTILIPRSALLGSAKEPQVFVVRGGRSVLRPIKTGRSAGDVIQVIDGIAEGELVVTTGHINLTNGSNVSIAGKSISK
jgi:RND family efflux transporter MFP subunit